MEVILGWFVTFVILVNGLNLTTIGKGRIIHSQTGQNIIINRDSLLVTISYDLTYVRSMWNNYISEAESLIQSVGKTDVWIKYLKIANILGS